jgi:hypothetical protein
MLPVDPMNDFTDGTLGYAQFAAQSTLRLGRPNSDENPLDKVFRQNDVGSILADGKAAIPVCIPDILLPRPIRKVR